MNLYKDLDQLSLEDLKRLQHINSAAVVEFSDLINQERKMLTWAKRDGFRCDIMAVINYNEEMLDKYQRRLNMVEAELLRRG